MVRPAVTGMVSVALAVTGTAHMQYEHRVVGSLSAPRWQLILSRSDTGANDGHDFCVAIEGGAHPEAISVGKTAQLFI